MGYKDDAIEAGIGQLVCDHFAYADAYDETNNRYLGLKATGGGVVVIDGSSVVVTPEAAKAQLDAEQPEPGPQPGPEPERGSAPAPGPSPEPPGPELPKAFLACRSLGKSFEGSANYARRHCKYLLEKGAICFGFPVTCLATTFHGYLTTCNENGGLTGRRKKMKKTVR